jgi:hypothetical protein
LENTTNNNAIEIFANAAREVRDLDIPSRREVEVLANSALRTIAAELEEKNFQGALDVLDKTKAIEDYWKKKIDRHNVQDVRTLNVWSAGRMRGLRECGVWLEENLNKSGVNRKYGAADNVLSGSFWLDDLGIDEQQSHRWQALAKVEDEEFDTLLNDFVNKLEDALTFDRVWKAIKPPKESDPEKPAEERESVDLTTEGKALYDAQKALKKAVVDYVNAAAKQTPPRQELFFLSELIGDTVKGLEAARDRIDLLAKKAK